MQGTRPLHLRFKLFLLGFHLRRVASVDLTATSVAVWAAEAAMAVACE